MYLLSDYPRKTDSHIHASVLSERDNAVSVNISVQIQTETEAQVFAYWWQQLQHYFNISAFLSTFNSLGNCFFFETEKTSVAFFKSFAPSFLYHAPTSNTRDSSFKETLFTDLEFALQSGPWYAY